jgi:hypothetical protein
MAPLVTSGGADHPGMTQPVETVADAGSSIDDIVWSQGNHLEVSFSDGGSMPVFADMVVAKVLALDAGLAPGPADDGTSHWMRAAS